MKRGKNNLCQPSLRSQRGQAMVELLAVAAFVLVPLFFAMPMLGKYLDMRAAAVEAARYAAWERTVWFGGSDWTANRKGNDELGKEMKVRLWSQTVGAYTNEDKKASAFRGGARKLWTSPSGDDVLRPYAENTLRMNNKTAPGTFNALLDLIPGSSNEAAADSGHSDWFDFPFKIDAKGRYGATVTMAVASVSAGSDADPWLRHGATPWRFTESHEVLANGWGASQPSGDRMSVQKMTSGLVPMALLTTGTMGQVVNGLLDVLSFSGFYELNSRSLQFGKIEPDEVPEDRLGGE